jgi:sugar lactone lactonase YvrE
MSSQQAVAREARVLLSGLAIGESPRWHEGRLWFSNWGTREVVAVDPAGRSEVVLRVPTTIPFSLDWLPDGRLLVVSGQEGVLLRREPDGSLVTHADLRPLSEHPWNEIVVDGRGHIYLNSIGFAFGEEDPRSGIIALVTPDGAVRRLADGIAFPNGMVVTPDNATLIVAESMAGRLTAFDIAPDGGLSNRRVWAELGFGGDGICLDAEGAVWTTAVAGGAPVCLRVHEGGRVTDRVDLDHFGFACMLGGDDRRTLFVLTADWHLDESFAENSRRLTTGPRTGRLLAAPAPAPGVAWP